MGECWLIGLVSTFPLDRRLCDEVGTSLTFLLRVSGSPVTMTGLCKWTDPKCGLVGKATGTGT